MFLPIFATLLLNCPQVLVTNNFDRGENWTLGLLDAANFVHCQDEYSRKIQKFDEQKQFSWILNANLCVENISQQSLNFFSHLHAKIAEWSQKLAEEKAKVEAENAKAFDAQFVADNIEFSDLFYCRKQRLDPISMIFRAQNVAIGRFFVQKMLTNDAEQQKQLGKIMRKLQEKGKVLDVVRYENKWAHYDQVHANIEIQLKQKLEFLRNCCNEKIENTFEDHLNILELIVRELGKVQVKVTERDFENADQLWTLDKRPSVRQTLWVIRHGERMDNINKNLCSAEELARDDSPLTSQGIRQAKELGNRLKRVAVTKMFSSPFTRSMQTAANGLLGDEEQLQKNGHATARIDVEPGLAELLVPCSFLLGFHETTELVKRFPAMVNQNYWPVFSKRTLSALQGQNNEKHCKFVVEKTINQILAANKTAEHIVLSTHGAFSAFLHELLTGEWTIVGQCSVSKFVRYGDDEEGKTEQKQSEGTTTKEHSDGTQVISTFRMEFTSDLSHLTDQHISRPY